MSSNSGMAEEFPFEIECASKEVAIRVYNGQGDLVEPAPAYGSLFLRLPKGIYVVRTELAGQVEEEFVRHEGQTSHPGKVPERLSPAPVKGQGTTANDYSEFSRKASTENTAQPLSSDTQPEARLFLFIRAKDKQTYQAEDLAADLCLTDARGKVLTRFEEASTRRDTDAGWLAFSAQAASGAYYLRYSGAEPRELPIYLYPTWQTQIFLLYVKKPLLAGMRLFMAKLEAGFNPDDEIAAAVDLALAGLQNDQNLVPRSLTMRDFVHKKWDNPILGLIGAYWLLREENLDVSLVEEVLENLGTLLPGSADVQALRILAAQRLGKPLPQEAIESPPVFLVGLQAVLAVGVDDQRILPATSQVSRILKRVYADSPWSSWKPIEESTRPSILAMVGSVLLALATWFIAPAVSASLQGPGAQLAEAIEKMKDNDFTSGGRLAFALGFVVFLWSVGLFLLKTVPIALPLGVSLWALILLRQRFWPEEPDWLLDCLSQELLWSLKAKQSLTVRDLALKFGVTSQMIQDDLHKLESKRSLIRDLAQRSKNSTDATRAAIRQLRQNPGLPS